MENEKQVSKLSLACSWSLVVLKDKISVLVPIADLGLEAFCVLVNITVRSFCCCIFDAVRQ